MEWTSTKESLPDQRSDVCVRYRGIEFKATYTPGENCFRLPSGKKVTFENEEMLWIPDPDGGECRPDDKPKKQ